MNAFQKFLESKPFGFVTVADMPELIRLHRLCQCLVRCGCKRFVCAAQDVEGMIKAVEAGGDYVRDVSVTAQELERAPLWRPEPVPELPERAKVRLSAAVERAREKGVFGPRFNEADCGGAFDGFTVTSDADPGL